MSMEPRRWALRLAYDGGAFRGWQRQPGLPTVQESLEGALAAVGLRPHLDAAARTDAGVHALEQVVTFTARTALTPEAMRAQVNARTPPGLLCLQAARVSPRAHARASALSRTYVYLVGWPAPPELTGRAWSLPDPRAFPSLENPRFDAGRARMVLASMVGERDFAPFARPGDQTARRRVDPRATVRELLRAELLLASDAPWAAIVLEGRGFLRAMARHLVGATVAVAVGELEPERLSPLWGDASARYRGPRAPAWGLTLARVRFGETLFPPLEPKPGER